MEARHLERMMHEVLSVVHAVAAGDARTHVHDTAIALDKSSVEDLLCSTRHVETHTAAVKYYLLIENADKAPVDIEDKEQRSRQQSKRK